MFAKKSPACAGPLALKAYRRKDFLKSAYNCQHRVKWRRYRCLMGGLGIREVQFVGQVFDVQLHAQVFADIVIRRGILTGIAG